MKKITIRSITLDDTKNIVKWRNSVAVRKNLYSQQELTEDQHISYFEKYISTKKTYQFVILEDASPIGTVFLKNVDAFSKNAEFGIFIGEPSARGKGYSYEATKQILKFAFDELNLDKIVLSVFSDNIPAKKTYEKIGFRTDYVKSEFFEHKNGIVEISFMSITKKAFTNS